MSQIVKIDLKNTKILIKDATEDSDVPFLRGILTRSLRDAGLTFVEAYRFSNEIRQRLSKKADEAGGPLKMSTEALKAYVGEYLEQDGKLDARDQYLHSRLGPGMTMVTDRDEQALPFSKSVLAQSLESCALSREQGYAIATSIEQELVAEGRCELASTQLAERIYEHLLAHVGPDHAHRYLVWIEYFHSGRPLILLVGGTTGSGKSTISSEISHRIRIVRSQSTDMLREVMRLMVPERLIPTLHTSSFSAWRALPTTGDVSGEAEMSMIEGYLLQSDQVGVGIEGVMQRAEKEQLSMIIEGIHIYPQLQDQLKNTTKALVIPMQLAVLKRKKLRKRLKGRGQKVPSRRAERYLDNFDAIWQLQTYLLSEADRLQVPIISNDDQDETIRSVMETISDYLLEDFSGDPELVFGRISTKE